MQIWRLKERGSARGALRWSGENSMQIRWLWDCGSRFLSHRFLWPGILESSPALPCAGNLANIRSTQKLSWISLFRARGRRMPSLLVTGTTRFESDWSNLTNQRVYQELVYRNGSFIKEMITGSAAPALPSFLPWEPGTGYQTKGLQRGWKQRARLERDATNTDCPFCIRDIRSNYPLLPATGNSHWLNFDASCHQAVK